MSVRDKRIGFVGGGTMGEALIKGLVRADLVAPKSLSAADVRPERLAELERRYGDALWWTSLAEIAGRCRATAPRQSG